MSERRTVGITLFLCFAASQSSLLVLTPVLAGVASDFGVSTALAGQLRTVSGLAAGVTAVLTGLVATRVGLRELLLGSLALIALGSTVSALAPDLAVLALAQAAIGAGIGFSYSAALAAVADWSTPEERSKVLAAALLGPPTAWVIGMPVAGLVGGVSWRLVWIAVRSPCR